MSLKVDRRVLIWTVIIYFFVLQRALISLSNSFSYVDELFTIFTVIGILLWSMRRLVVFSKTECMVLILLCITCVIGVIGNLTSNIMTEVYPIMIDIVSTIKVWIAYYPLIITKWPLKVYDDLIRGLARIGRLMVGIMLICLILAECGNIGMVGSARYGIKSFQFIYNVPGNFSKLFYFLVPLLTADLYYKSSNYKKVMLFLSLIIWASSMRARAFAFIAVYLLMAFFFFTANGRKWGNHVRRKIKIVYLIPAVLIVAAISWKQLIFYFTTDTQARSVLLRYGIITMLSYFPIGAGFGTFGSDVAATHYSELYKMYGFNSFYGMRQGEEYFLNDNYWPMIIGQFGAIGGIAVAGALFIFMRMILNETKNNKYFYFASFSAIGFLLLSSVASKSYSEFSSICVFMLLGLFVKRSRSINIKGDVKDNVS